MNNKNLKKYRQAAAVYLVNAIAFLVLFGQETGSHDFGIWTTLLYTMGIVMIGLFAFLIYRGHRTVALILAGVCIIRTVVSTFSLPFFTVIISSMYLFQVISCFMLLRAAFDIEIRIRKRSGG